MKMLALGKYKVRGMILAGTMGHPILLGANTMELCDVGGVIVDGERSQAQEVLGLPRPILKRILF